MAFRKKVKSPFHVCLCADVNKLNMLKVLLYFNFGKFLYPYIIISLSIMIMNILSTVLNKVRAGYNYQI